MMNNSKLTISAYYRLGILERILRVIRHRGAHVVTMDMQVLENNMLGMNITVQSERAITLVANQLQKLIDVTDVQVESLSQA
ncbi:acetolactate synthase 2 small subunit [Utexia brackfieldae]|uniref:acetolactate synthase 2 small subunit n=1 Tax=Utexia brackfieldae TaxID=3074108 RepID=UPI00370D4B68